MFGRIKSGLTYANVMATLAVFVALGGTTIAATKISGSQIKKASVTGKQIKRSSVPGNRLRPGTVGGRQVSEAALGEVPAATVAARAAVAQKALQADQADQADRAESAGQAATAADAALLEGRSAEQLTDSCPGGTQPYAGACFETGIRAGATWPDAAEICGDAGRRLPGLAELEGFRQEPGILISGGSGPEHTAEYYDSNGINADGEFTVGLYENGGITVGLEYGSSHADYRCVAPLTNRG